ncbi:MAG TPA: hypothetical protein VN795_04445 [Stellaceae bacterium]|nr:hypothetical protein [Stellaceae bacterium]
MTKSINTASALALAMGLVLTGFIGYESTKAPPISQAQFEQQVEEGFGSFNQLPAHWAALHKR